MRNSHTKSGLSHRRAVLLKSGGRKAGNGAGSKEVPLARAPLRGCDAHAGRTFAAGAESRGCACGAGGARGTVPTRASHPHSRRPARTAWSTQPRVLRAPRSPGSLGVATSCGETSRRVACCYPTRRKCLWPREPARRTPPLHQLEFQVMIQENALT